MHAELPVLSFLCVALLLALAPLHWKSRNVAILSLMAWLMICNSIQGVNSLLWRSDTAVRAAVWCDIASKFRLGGQLALPATCACVCWHLYFLSNSNNGKRRKHRNIVELIVCLLCPLIYMAIHTIVQSHRFELIQDFGCSSSIFTSSIALVLVWIPPLILCSITYVFAALALTSHLRVDRARLATHTVTLNFIRPLLTSIIIASITLLATIFNIYCHITSVGGLQPWRSLSETHVHFSEVHFVSQSSRLDFTRITVEWWGIPAASIAFIVPSFIGLIFGTRNDESMVGVRTVSRWIDRRILHKSVGIQSFITSSDDFSRSITLKSPPTPTPVHLLKSGWDDTLRSDHSPRKAKPKPPPIICDMPPSPSSTSESETEPDTSFVVSTLTYLQSPTGSQALELPRRAKMRTLQSAQPAPLQSSNRLSVPVQGHVSESPASFTQSLLSAPWPEPPSSIPISPHSLSTESLPSPASAYSQASSRAIRHASTSSISGSIASSTISTNGYAVYDPALPPPTPHRAPFENSGIPANIPTSPKPVRSMGSKDTLSSRKLVHGLSRKGKDRPSTRERAEAEGIFMTVVQETV
ncbi:unnamed protein product [Somion occarium]|uniref:Pheromone receptor n=1 Tax=Somion occarium TaxID=3059160 RepID=A0ABP1D7S9_9APHY